MMTTRDYANASIFWFMWRTIKLWFGEELPRIGYDFLRATAALVVLILLILTAPIGIPVAAYLSRRYWRKELKKIVERESRRVRK